MLGNSPDVQYTSNMPIVFHQTNIGKMDTVAGFASIYEYSFVKAQSTNLINTPVCKHSETAWYVLV